MIHNIYTYTSLNSLPGQSGFLHLQFVQDRLDLLKPRPLVGICIPADVDDPLQMVIDELGDDGTGIFLSHLRRGEGAYT